MPTRSSPGVDVIVNSRVLSLAPHCPHGPTLLFERYGGKDGTVERYFACSASRDRKTCKFLQKYGEKVSEEKARVRMIHNKAQQPWQDQYQFYERLQRTTECQVSQRRYCHTCNLLLVPLETEAHKHHKILQGIPDNLLDNPTKLMNPIEDNKTHAQYLFSSKTSSFLAQTIKGLDMNRVLCIGVPRLHEYFNRNKLLEIDSLLLDLDHRYAQFYSPDQFCRYNMFNDHFLDGTASQTVFEKFLRRNKGKGVILVIDPPFGGMIEALVYSIKQLMEKWSQLSQLASNQALPVMWIFPYFFENRIVKSLQSFSMLDYKVDYDNHALFKCGPDAKKKKSSPVRIFTNICPSKIVLPKNEGYRFCNPCERYVSHENHHCKVCNSCSSKDGSRYKHCYHCGYCVKPSYQHCKICKKCELPSHDCNRILEGCHLCGDLKHKRQECPKRETFEYEEGGSDQYLPKDGNALSASSASVGSTHSVTVKKMRQKGLNRNYTKSAQKSFPGKCVGRTASKSTKHTKYVFSRTMKMKRAKRYHGYCYPFSLDRREISRNSGEGLNALDKKIERLRAKRSRVKNLDKF